jgi:uncharacterized protein (DUF1810 family)
VNHPTDRYDLARFVEAQARSYRQALAEIKAGRKQSHWMWYVFPQFAGLGNSPTSRHYAIKSVEEARAYLAHPVLGPRMVECADALLQTKERSAHDIFGSPDDLKLRSSATLFASVSTPGSIFDRIIERYFDGEPDDRTTALISKSHRL